MELETWENRSSHMLPFGYKFTMYLLYLWSATIFKSYRELHGEAVEVETDDKGECINPYVRVGISIEITKPLEKMIFLERKDDNEVKLLVMCKGFLDLWTH